MARSANSDLNRLTLHSALQQLAWSVTDAFSAVFLYRQGLEPATIYLAIAGVLALRFLLRPTVLAIVARTGLKTTLMAGAALSALQAALLAPIRGVDAALVAYVVVSAVAEVLYWSSYHAMFASVGDAERRGSQVGLRQLLVAAAGVAGPAAGGLALAISAPGSPSAPRGRCNSPRSRRSSAAPIGRWRASPRRALFAPRSAARCRSPPTAGFSAAPAGPGAWSSSRRSAPVSTRSAASSPRRRWQARSAGWRSVARSTLAARRARRGSTPLVLAATLAAKAMCGEQAIAVLVVAIGAALLGGLYNPSLMTAIYNEAKASPCPLRYHLALEAAWDVGGALACLAAAAVLACGARLQFVILLALPLVALQAAGLRASYAARREATAVAAPTAAPSR